MKQVHNPNIPNEPEDRSEKNKNEFNNFQPCNNGTNS